MTASRKENGTLMPLLLGLFVGSLPLVLGGDLRLSLFVILIFLGLSIIMLLGKLGLAHKAVVFVLGGALIINPNKFFMAEGILATNFGGIPLPFISLLDLAVIALLCMKLQLRKHPLPGSARIPKWIIFALAAWVLFMTSSLLGTTTSAGVWHFTFELKCLVLFFTIGVLARPGDDGDIMEVLELLFLGLSAGLAAETLAVVAEYSGALGAGISLLGVTAGGVAEDLGGVVAHRVGGTYLHPNYLAIPMASLLIPMAAMALKSHGIKRLAYAGGVGCCSFNLLLTLSRGGWFAAAVSLTAFLTLLLSTQKGLEFLKRSRWFICVFVFIGMIALGAFSDKIADKIFLSSSSNFSGRVTLNEMGMEMIKSHPIFGVGLNNSVKASDEYGLMHQFVKFTGFQPVIHNIYILLGAEIGIPGVLTFLCFSLFLLTKGWNLSRQNLYHGTPAFLLGAIASGGFAYLAADLFGPGLRKLEIAYLFWWHLGLVLLLIRHVTTRNAAGFGKGE